MTAGPPPGRSDGPHPDLPADLPPDLPPDLAEALTTLAAEARRGAALVALDFDGVLAPLVDDPATSRPLPAAAHALDRLAAAHVPLALVSGRTLADLAALAHPPSGTHLVGGHGAERGRTTGGGLDRLPLVLPPGPARRLADLTAQVERVAAGTTARVERKPAAVVLHTRTASPDDADRLPGAVAALGEAGGADVLVGKDVVELSVLDVSKGQALAALRAELGVGRVLFAGDDVTDERAFVALAPDDVTVKVGPGATAARYRVADPAAVAGVLQALANLVESGA